MKPCTICASEKLQPILSVAEYPYFTVPVSSDKRQEILANYKSQQLSSTLSIDACKNCGHCRQTDLPDFKILNDLYANYYHYPSPLEANFKPERDDTFIKILREFINANPTASANEKVLEVGCFDGYVLYHLQEAGFDVLGCDPSEGALIGQKHGVDVRKQFFEPESFLAEGLTFDIVISRHFVEHVVSPIDYITNFKRVLSDNGLLVIEVPNATYYLSSGLTEVFSPQHVQGFSPASLTRLLNQAGFCDITVIESENNLIAFARQNTQPALTYRSIDYARVIHDFTAAVERNHREIQTIITDYTRANKQIAMWGAGGFAIAAFKLYGLKPNAIHCIIDSDPKKTGMQFLGIDLEIKLPTPELIDELDLIIVTSMYTHSIVEAIQALSDKPDILTIYPSIKHLQPSSKSTGIPLKNCLD